MRFFSRIFTRMIDAENQSQGEKHIVVDDDKKTVLIPQNAFAMLFVFCSSDCD